MGLEGREFAARHYRTETLVENVDTLYRELLRKKNPAWEALCTS